MSVNFNSNYDETRIQNILDALKPTQQELEIKMLNLGIEWLDVTKQLAEANQLTPDMLRRSVDILEIMRTALGSKT